MAARDVISQAIRSIAGHNIELLPQTQISVGSVRAAVHYLSARNWVMCDKLSVLRPLFVYWLIPSEARVDHTYLSCWLRYYA